MPTTTKTKEVKAGAWRTLEWFFGSSGHTRFFGPAGVQIKVRYGVGWFGWDRQKQTLDEVSAKTLSVGSGGSFARARMQAKSAQTIQLTYDLTLPGS
jgi:hypothetical protein